MINISHVKCCTRVLSLIVLDGLFEIDKSILKLRDVVKYIDGYDFTFTKFNEAVKDSNFVFSNKLRLDVITRWNAVHLMIYRALEVKDPIY